MPPRTVRTKTTIDVKVTEKELPKRGRGKKKPTEESDLDTEKSEVVDEIAANIEKKTKRGKKVANTNSQEDTNGVVLEKVPAKKGKKNNVEEPAQEEEPVSISDSTEQGESPVSSEKSKQKSEQTETNSHVEETDTPTKPVTDRNKQTKNEASLESNSFKTKVKETGRGKKNLAVVENEQEKEQDETAKPAAKDRRRKANLTFETQVETEDKTESKNEDSKPEPRVTRGTKKTQSKVVSGKSPESEVVEKVEIKKSEPKGRRGKKMDEETEEPAEDPASKKRKVIKKKDSKDEELIEQKAVPQSKPAKGRRGQKKVAEETNDAEDTMSKGELKPADKDSNDEELREEEEVPQHILAKGRRGQKKVAEEANDAEDTGSKDQLKPADKDSNDGELIEEGEVPQHLVAKGRRGQKKVAEETNDAEDTGSKDQLKPADKVESEEEVMQKDVPPARPARPRRGKMAAIVALNAGDEPRDDGEPTSKRRRKPTAENVESEEEVTHKDVPPARPARPRRGKMAANVALNAGDEPRDDGEPTSKRRRKPTAENDSNDGELIEEGEVPQSKPARGRRGQKKVAEETNDAEDTMSKGELKPADKDSKDEELIEEEEVPQHILAKGRQGQKKVAEETNDAEDTGSKNQLNPADKVESEEEVMQKDVPPARPARPRRGKMAAIVALNAGDEPRDDGEPTSKRRRKPTAENDPAQETKKKAPLKNKSTTDYGGIDFTNTSKSSQGKEWNFKISSWNVDGVRAWLGKGGLEYIEHEKPDILCLQELKCSLDKFPDQLANLPGYHAYWLPSDSDGSTGVCIYTTKLAISVQYGLQHEKLDAEGRIITVELEHFYLICTCVPNAGRQLVTLRKRLHWDEQFTKYVTELDKKKPVIICGDMNVAHNEIDLANPTAKRRNAGFTVEERANMSRLLRAGFVDTYRQLYPQRAAYTFWAYMMNSRAKNMGWRLDYFIVSERILRCVCDSVIREQVYGSDHCPITLFLHLTNADKFKERVK